MNTYEMQSLEHRIHTDNAEIFTLFLFACWFVGFIFGFLIAITTY